MEQLTNEMIIEELNKNLPYSKFIFSGGLILIFLVMGIGFFIEYKKRKKGSSIFFVVIAFLLCVFFVGEFLKADAIYYSLNNNSFEVVIDTVAKKDIEVSRNRSGGGIRVNYVYLSNNRKITVNSREYSDVSEGDSVYVVIAKDRFGGRYPTGQIFSTSKYEYVNK